MALEMFQQTIIGLPAPVYFFAFGFLLIGWYVARRLRDNKRRGNEVRNWCGRSGFQHEEGPVPAKDLAPIQALTPSSEEKPGGLGLGTGRITSMDALRIATGTHDGWSLRIFDMASITQTSADRYGRVKSSPSFRTWLLMECIGCELPRLELSVLSVGTSLGARLMGATANIADAFSDGALARVSVPGHPGIILACDQPDRASALIEPLTASDFFRDKRGLQIKTEGPWIMVGRDPILAGSGWCSRPRDYVAAKKYDEIIAIAVQLAEHFRAVR